MVGRGFDQGDPYGSKLGLRKLPGLTGPRIVFLTTPPIRGVIRPFSWVVVIGILLGF